MADGYGLGGSEVSLVDRSPSVAEYRSLRAAVGWSTADDVGQDLLDRALCAVVAGSVAGGAVGMGRVVGDGVYGFLVDVVVHPAHQCTGVGRAVIDHLVAAACCAGIGHLALGAAQDVVPFYGAMGWRADGTTYLRLTSRHQPSVAGGPRRPPVVS